MIRMLHAQIIQARSFVLAIVVLPDLGHHVQVCHFNGRFKVNRS